MKTIYIKSTFRDYKECYPKDEINNLELFLDETKENGMFEFAIDDSYIMIAYNCDDPVNSRELQDYLYENNDIAFEAYYEQQEVKIT